MPNPAKDFIKAAKRGNLIALKSLFESDASLLEARDTDGSKSSGASLCILRVLCVSVVEFSRNNPHHRGTEYTEDAQRRIKIRTLLFELNKSRAGFPMNVGSPTLGTTGFRTRVVFNGKTSPEEMPPEIRQAYDQAMATVLADADGDGVPDIFETGNATIFHRALSRHINWQKLWAKQPPVPTATLIHLFFQVATGLCGQE